MRRRDSIKGIASATAWPLATRAQAPGMPVIGFLNSASPGPFAQLVQAFRDGLGETNHVNAAAKMHRLAGAKIHQRCWQEGPRTGGLSSVIRLGRDYPPVCPSWHGVSGSCSD